MYLKKNKFSTAYSERRCTAGGDLKGDNGGGVDDSCGGGGVDDSCGGGGVDDSCGGGIVGGFSVGVWGAVGATSGGGVPGVTSAMLCCSSGKGGVGATYFLNEGDNADFVCVITMLRGGAVFASSALLDLQKQKKFSMCFFFKKNTSSCCFVWYSDLLYFWNRFLFLNINCSCSRQVRSYFSFLLSFFFSPANIFFSYFATMLLNDIFLFFFAYSILTASAVSLLFGALLVSFD